MKKCFNYLLLSLFCFVLFSFPVRAENQKQIEVNLEKEYVSAIFTFTSSDCDLSNCDIFIHNPNGTIFEVKEKSHSTAVCSINGVDSGRWNIYFYSTDGTPVGKVDVKVEGLKTQIVNESEEIKVASDITGLKIYLKDQNLVVEWKDNSCGSVDIDVYNSKTMQVLDSSSVSEQEPCYYEFAIPSSERELLVAVVPSSSASYEGATNHYTIEVYNNPSAEVAFDGSVYTNLSSYEATAILEKPYSIMLEANGKVIMDEKPYLAGSHTLSFPVSDGENHFVAYIIDEKGNMKSFSTNIYADYIAPELTVTNSSELLTLNEEIYEVSGFVNNYTVIYVNDKEVTEIYDDGAFRYSYTLHEGENRIKVVALDDAGNQSSSEIIVNYEIPEEDNSSFYIFVVILVLAVIVLFLKKIHGNKQFVEEDTEDDEDMDEQEDSETDERESVKKTRRAPLASPYEESFLLKYKWLITPIILIATYFVLTHYLLAQVIVTSASMEPTLKTGDLLFFNRLAYEKNEVERGDIICFYDEETNAYMGKRIIGLPGEKICFVDGYVCIDGNFMDESMYITDDIETNCDKTFVVPENSYFVLGDNREKSRDSRYFENPYIPKEDIVGKYIGNTGINFSFLFF